MEKTMQLTDNNEATCLVLAETAMYTFHPSTRRWTPEPQGKCLHHGLMVKIHVPSVIKVHVTVTITGRHLVCSNSHLKVAMRHTKRSQCESAGLYRTCTLTGPTGPGDGGLTSCVAKCTCDGEDCQHVYVQIPNLQQQLEICEIYIM